MALGVDFKPLRVQFWLWEYFLGFYELTLAVIGLIGMGESWASWSILSKNEPLKIAFWLLDISLGPLRVDVRHLRVDLH